MSIFFYYRYNLKSVDLNVIIWYISIISEMRLILKSYGCKKVFVDPDEEPYTYYCKIGFEKSNYSKGYKKAFE